ncbi:PIG-L deacetylase family protein [Catalinimonas niigatensis]|uniref:PIG-L deacetylase family protein n=1 Tax=Catalinimonas niigatensis TaxID=1397264 RepID=UPI0026659DBD|nr:PIG-L family deacetylase [Catalinimonas niigatensis]WPP52591.1 PIG-L family deacetylase [Catalinimonas niigatensis]
MKLLYVFPHPDDESFGPAGAMYTQLQQGHEMHLLTLTKGEATKQRHKLGVSLEEMGEIRFQEMQKVKKTLGLTSLTVLDLPDNKLKALDPRMIETVVRNHIEKIEPDILVSYPVHGISGFHDHLVMHAVTKRVYLEIKDAGHDYLKRLAFFTIPDNGDPQFKKPDGFRLKNSTQEEIDCIIDLSDEAINKFKQALMCYETYQEVIEKTGVIKEIGDKVHFEIFGESFDPPLDDLTLNILK